MNGWPLKKINKTLGVFFLVTLCLAGCTKLGYQYMNDPSRDAWQKPTEVIARLAIQPGMRVADIGAGGGYFTWYLADAVGPEGKVYAVDIDETALSIIKEEQQSREVSNVRLIHAEPGDPKLPEPVDLVFSSNIYHHMQDRVVYFRSLAHYLSADGRVAILEYHPHGFVSGWLGHGTAKEEVRREMEAAGYQLLEDYDMLDDQHFQVFSKNHS